MDGSLGITKASVNFFYGGRKNSTCVALHWVLGRSNDTINGKVLWEYKVLGNHMAFLCSLAAGSSPPLYFSQGILFISTAKLIYFSALAPIPSLKQHQFWLLSSKLQSVFEFTLLPLVRFPSLPPFFFFLTLICRGAWDLVHWRLAWCSATGYASEEQSFLFIS